MIRLFILIAVVNLLMSCSQDQAENIKGEILQYGIYNAIGQQRTAPDDNIPSGKLRYSSGGMKLVKQTTKIPRVFGTHFGYEYLLSGLPNIKEVVLEQIITHPPITRPNGKTTTSFKYTKIAKPKNGIFKGSSSYIMNHEYELVEGDWTISFYYQEKLILTKTFNVSMNHTL